MLRVSGLIAEPSGGSVVTESTRPRSCQASSPYSCSLDKLKWPSVELIRESKRRRGSMGVPREPR